jgi:hypothetical protein
MFPISSFQHVRGVASERNKRRKMIYHISHSLEDVDSIIEELGCVCMLLRL